YKKFISLYNNQLRRNLRTTHDSAYIWNMTWDYPWPYRIECNPPAPEAIIQDVSHGNHVITYIVESYELGIGGWSGIDIKRFVNTVKYLIYDPRNNRFNGDLNGNFVPKVASGIQ